MTEVEITVEKAAGGRELPKKKRLTLSRCCLHALAQRRYR